MDRAGTRAGVFVIAVATGGIGLSACSSSGHPGASTSPTHASTPATTSAATSSAQYTTPAPSGASAAASAAFCAQLGAYGRQVKGVFSGGGKLATVKAELPPVVSSGQALAAKAPSTIRGSLTSLVSDVGQFNTYVQTKATQASLDSSKVPTEIAKPLADLQVSGAAVKLWDQANCHGTFGS